MNYPLIINSLIFNIIWFCCVYFQAAGVAALLLIIWAIYQYKQLSYWRYFLTLSATGIAVDSLLIHFDWMLFGEPVVIPRFLVLLWIAFSFYSTILFKHLPFNYGVYTVISGIAGVSSYIAAEALGAVKINWNFDAFTAAFIAFWILFLPCSQLLYRRMSCSKQSAHH
ncbi:DUF2878 domain-containing protein [Thalassotalea crassostreae]|uniref:DUF2878 domain-containing protein n=1 Tax=Thalassotalea crassostreae TaxID=1763536 RepID=UPI0008391B79|nr:DUF2878 domain-containing protein [Thalassotalea crassostreae]